MTRRNAPPTEMPPAGQGRPLDGLLDSLETLFDFEPVFDRAVDRVTAADSNTRIALHELVCILSTRVHIERVILVPLLTDHRDAADYRHHAGPSHHRIEVLLSVIDRRGVSDPNLPSMFEELQKVVRANIGHQRSAAASIRSSLDTGQADELRERLDAAVDTAMTRPHPHLPHRGPFADVAGGLIATIDRLRNRSPVR